MRVGSTAAFAAFAGVMGLSSAAQAELPRDYFLDPPAAGTFALLDAYTIGAQASLENRAHLEEGMSMLTTRLSGIASFPYTEGSFNVDARLFLFTLGGSVGYRNVHRNLTFAPGEDRSREARRDRESDKAFDSQAFPYAEGRLRLTIPLDDFFMVNTFTMRWEDQRDNSFDWLHGNVHDAGMMSKFESTLFYRHRDFGGIGPTFRYLRSRKTTADGGFATDGELNVGLAFGTRPGFIRARGRAADLFLFTVSFRVNDKDEEFGLHGYQGAIPMYPLLVYRAQLPLL
jgi:hypothetical protein